MTNKNYLLDKEFLKQLDNDRNRVVSVKLIAMDFDENPLEEILGQVTSGSINIDGTSAVRRTCSLSLVANELNIHEYYWGIKSKFKVYIGLKNRINEDYPEIIWFNQGTYIITSFNTSQAVNSWTVSISGKDKMCLLNGDLGGSLTAISVDFGQETIITEDGSYVKNKLLIKDIIREGVHEYAREPYHNIIINDLDEAALELMEYRGTTPLYLAVESTTGEITNQTLNGDTTYYLTANQQIKVSALTNEQLDHRIDLNFEQQFSYEKRNLTASTYKKNTYYYYDNDLNEFEFATGDFDSNEIYYEKVFKNKNNYSPTKLYRTAAEVGGSLYYTIIKAEYGDVVGYRLTTLTYAGDLIGNVGEAFTSCCLDKIKNMLGDYEYFYNLDGQFIWQRKPTYINVSWNNLEQGWDEADKEHGESAAYTSSISYSFENSNLVTAFTNSPDLLNVKNDYSIFGEKTLQSGQTVPVHIRYAIDKKPTYYRDYNGIIWTTEPLPDEIIRDIAAELAQRELNQRINVWAKQEMPKNADGTPKLSDDWWDILDWAEYYKQLTGHYPEGNMNLYRTSTTTLDVKSLFPGSGVAWNPNSQIFLFDIVDNKLYYVGHNPSCSHAYQYFVNEYAYFAQQGKEYHSYFYKPQLPEAVITEEYDRIYTTIAAEANKVVDWREIIYRMAWDYMHYSMNDINCYERVTESMNQEKLNNGEYFYSTYKYLKAYTYDEDQTYYTYNSSNKSYTKVTSTLSQKEINKGIYFYRQEQMEYKPCITYDANGNATPMRYNANLTYYTYTSYLERFIQNNLSYYPTGVTGYEQYYTDIISFWRELYDPEYLGTFNVASPTKSKYEKEGSKYYWFKNQEGQKYNANAVYYYQDLYGNWRAKKQLAESDFINNKKNYFLPIQGKNNYSGTNKDYIYQSAASGRVYYTKTLTEYYGAKDTYPYWARAIFEMPEKMNFWFDFLDTDGDLQKYSIPMIGDRPKAENNTDIKAVYYRETPNVIFVNTDAEKADLKETQKGYTFISLNNNINHLFTISAQGQSCKDKLNTLLYQYAICAESISITAIPIYYLEPNTRIFVTDLESGINGEYIVQRISYQLSYNGTMNITATKAVDKIY